MTPRYNTRLKQRKRYSNLTYEFVFKRRRRERVKPGDLLSPMQHRWFRLAKMPKYRVALNGFRSSNRPRKDGTQTMILYPSKFIDEEKAKEAALALIGDVTEIKTVGRPY